MENSKQKLDLLLLPANYGLKSTISPLLELQKDLKPVLSMPTSIIFHMENNSPAFSKEEAYFLLTYLKIMLVFISLYSIYLFMMLYIQNK